VKIYRTEVVKNKVNVGWTDVCRQDHEWANESFRLYLPDDEELKRCEEYKLKFKLKDKDVMSRSDVICSITVAGADIRKMIKHTSDGGIDKKVLLSDPDEQGEVECRFFIQRVSEFTDPEHRPSTEDKAKAKV
jgi:hypothetical protein